MQCNEEIRDDEIRLVGDGGEQLGIMNSKEALSMAVSQNLDLVKIAPNAKPPVCRIMNYGKYKFDQSKREKEARKNQKIVEIKEIRISFNIDTHDFETKANHAMKFLQSGHKIKISMRFRGREMAHTKLGEQNLIKFGEAVSEYGTVDRIPKLEGRSMIMFITSKTPNLKKSDE